MTNMQSVCYYLTKNLERLRGEYVCVSNVHTTVMAYNDASYKEVQNNAVIAVPDGKPLSLISRVRGYKSAQRVAGPDLMPEILKISETEGYTHYFYGSTKATLEALRTALVRRYPKLQIAGMYSPPFRDLTKAEDEEVVRLYGKTTPKPPVFSVAPGTYDTWQMVEIRSENREEIILRY